MMVFSLIALAIGLIYAIGTARRWAALDPLARHGISRRRLTARS